jgi:hypothetical protein
MAGKKPKELVEKTLIMKGGYRWHTDDEIAEALRAHRGLIALAAEALGMSYQGVRDRVASSPRLQAVKESATERIMDKAEDNLAKAIENGDAAISFKVLSTKGRRRGYVERTEQVITAEAGSPFDALLKAAAGGKQDKATKGEPHAED